MTVPAAGRTMDLLRTARRTGLLDPTRIAAAATAATSWGPSTAALYAANALRHPTRLAVVDEYGSITYLQLHRRTNRVAAALKGAGVGATTTVGVLCRNHRGFVEANVAAAKTGARVVYLNTALPASQLETVIQRESVTTVIADRDLAGRIGPGVGANVVVAAPDEEADWSFPDLGRHQPFFRIPGPRAAADPILLTSGTTGAPKGARRTATAAATASAFGVLEAIPYQRHDVFAVPAPLFHAWGLSQLVLAASLAGTVVLRERFEADAVAADIEARGATVFAAVPVMLHRILEASPDADLSGLRITASSGSALPGTLATEWMDRYGDNLYNLYGSTEIGQVSIAGPADLRAAPGTAGRPLRGVDLRILDADGDELPDGTVGSIAVASANLFDGYTGGGSKDVVDDHMLIGDQGYIEDELLFVVGRVDDMIISGGENVYPSNIERSLLAHTDVSEAVVVGVPDDDLGQRIRAIVVLQPGADHAGAPDRLRRHLESRLARYEVPRELVVVDELPRNAAGKILRRDLDGVDRTAGKESS